MDYNSDFSHDLEVGLIGERKLGEILDHSTIEVKTDFGTLKTGNVFVEYSSRGKASGISRTKAQYYAFVLTNDIIVIVPTQYLKDKCRPYLNTNRDVTGGDSETSKGVLLPIVDLFKLDN
jgi:hypothetical protein